MTLNHSPAEIVRRLLVNLGHGTLPSANGAWPIYATQENDTPDNAISVIDTAGNTQGRVHTSGETNEFFGISIRVRSAKHQSGWLKLRELSVAIDKEVYRNTVTLDSTTYTVCAITRKAGLGFGGKESVSNRRQFTIDAVVSLE